MMCHGRLTETSSLGDLNVSHGRIMRTSQPVLCQSRGDILAHLTVAESPLVVTEHVVS